MHIDSRFVDRIAAEDEEAVQTLNRVLFSLFRSGRLNDAKTLLQNLEAPALVSMVTIREFLTNPRLSPLDRIDEFYDLAKSRMFFKQTARELIPTVKFKINIIQLAKVSSDFKGLSKPKFIFRMMSVYRPRTNAFGRP